jgi:hypothetical protein
MPHKGIENLGWGSVQPIFEFPLARVCFIPRKRMGAWRDRLFLSALRAGFRVEAAARRLGFLKEAVHSVVLSPWVFPWRPQSDIVCLIPYPHRVVKKKCHLSRAKN